MDELKPPFELEFPDPDSEMSEAGEKRYDLGQINATEARGDVSRDPQTEAPVETTNSSPPQKEKPSTPDIDRKGKNLHELERADRDAPAHNPTKQDHLYGPK
jgi:hypothetical protein